MRTLFADLLFNDGVDLSPDQAEKLEEKLKTDPEDMESRAMLLGFYFGRSGEQARARRRHHVLWIIANRPEVDIAGFAPCNLHPKIDGEAYRQVKELWLKHLREDEGNIAILRNAANFFARCEKEIAEELYKKAREIEPDNPEWSITLGRLYRLACIGGSEQDVKQYATAALQEFERAYEHELDELTLFCLLNDLAKTALDVMDISKARTYADQVLQLAPKYSDWRYGINAIYQGNVILGRIALLENDIERAKGYLIKAGQTPDSPELDSFQMSMILAKELLQRGEREVVLEYLTLCGKFWFCRKKQLQEWKKQIRSGHIPDLETCLLH